MRRAHHLHDPGPAELALLNELWGHVNLRKNMFLPTKKANGWRTMKSGRNTRTYDQPRTPYQRVLAAGNLAPEQAARLAALHDTTNPADLTRNIVRLQQKLIESAKAKTLALRDQVS